MKIKMQKMGIVVGVSLIAVLGVASFSSAEIMRPERLERGGVVLRSSLLGQLFSLWPISAMRGSQPDNNGNCAASNNNNNNLRCCQGNQAPSQGCINCKYKCLSFSSKIATPHGEVNVVDLKVGDIVWTVDATGGRAVRPLIRVSRVPVLNHHVVHLILTDGRVLNISAPHPTADGRTVGDLEVGEAYNGSIVRSAALKAYEGSATYDILPAGDTGYYWANGILMGSTLKQ